MGIESFARTLPALAGMMLAITLASMFASVRNDLADLRIDRISNTSRPLASARIAAGPALAASLLALLVAILIATTLGPTCVLVLIGISLLYELYSSPPWRLKRLPILAKLIIGLNSLLVAVAGYELAGGDLRTFPLDWALYLLIAIGLAANFIDLKDIEGDRADGIRTLPVWLGFANAVRLITVFTTMAYVWAAALLASVWLVPVTVILLCCHVRAIHHRPYSEAPVFRWYLLSQTSLVGALCLTALPFWR
ncbi:MAG: UbiA family prenyltransferase [Ahniella sp.]|nr:UbiA family prenyltransferase [Ahniella sp.]